MEPNYYQKPVNPETPRIVFRLIMLGALVLCVLLIVLTGSGYGHLTLDVPSNASVTINGHPVRQENIKLRPGTYQVGVQTAKYYSSYQNVKISMFLTKHYKPALKERSASSVISASSDSLQGLQADHPIWLEHNTWLAAIAGRGGAAVVTTHYTNGAWQLVYDGRGTPDVSKMPTSVINAISQLTGDLSAYN